MRRSAAIMAVILFFAQGALAAGCRYSCFDAGFVTSRPVQRVVPKPVARATPPPAPKPVVRATPAPAPKPATVAASLGLHRVTQVWTADVVTRSGPVTTYTSTTAPQDPGTYAKQVATVATGQKSAYDASLSNGRTTLSDGRAVSGDIYANYVWTGSTLQLDRYVFFQEDREVARQAAPAPTPAPARTPSPTPRPAPAPTPVPPGTSVAPPPAVPWSAPARPVPGVTPPPAPAPMPTPTPHPRVVIAYVALAAQGDRLARIEVLRGRRVDLWPRALVDGAPGRVTSWTLAAGEVSALGPLNGSGDQPLAAMWESVARNAAPYTLRFTVTVDVPGEGQRRVDAFIDVVVRSPAIVE